VNRVFLSQPLEIGQYLVGAEEIVMRGVEFLKRDRPGIAVDVDLPARRHLRILAGIVPADRHIVFAHRASPSFAAFHQCIALPERIQSDEAAITSHPPSRGGWK
jgi:hypothetical protein